MAEHEDEDEDEDMVATMTTKIMVAKTLKTVLVTIVVQILLATKGNMVVDAGA